MKLRRPSPALIVSIVALVVAMSGTAVATGILITSSHQVRRGVLTGTNIKHGSIGLTNLSHGAVSAIVAQAVAGAKVPAGQPTVPAAAFEIARSAPTPTLAAFKQVAVATLPLGAGAYAIEANVVLSSASSPDLGVLTELARNNKTDTGHCVLVVPNGENDEAVGPIATPFSQAPTTLHLQTVRTLPASGAATLNCDAMLPFTASNISLVAVQVNTASRNPNG